MENFTFYAPTKVVFGKNTEQQTGSLVRMEHGKKVLIHYGSGSAVKSGLLDRITASLDEAGIPYVTLGGVVPNPRLSKVYEGIALCQKENVDFLLAVGGGSVIDSTKAIGYGLANPDIDVWSLYEKKAAAKGCYPIGCILTLAATGSEMSRSSVITNEENRLKRGYGSDYCRPRFAIMNPELTYSLPAYQTASGCVDILMHTLERYLMKSDTLELTDGMAETLMRTVIKNARILKKDPQNYQARAEVMWAGSLSHNNLMECGGVHGDWSCHQLEHELSGMFDIAHGAGLAAIWGSWARYVFLEYPQRFAKLAAQVFDIAWDDVHHEDAALKGIAAMEEFFREIDMPTSIRELNLAPTPDQIQELTEKCSFWGTRTIGNIKALTSEDMAAIYKLALN